VLFISLAKEVCVKGPNGRKRMPNARTFASNVCSCVEYPLSLGGTGSHLSVIISSCLSQCDDVSCCKTVTYPICGAKKFGEYATVGSWPLALGAWGTGWREIKQNGETQQIPNVIHTCSTPVPSVKKDVCNSIRRWPVVIFPHFPRRR